jgi:hypothetical protein
MPDINTDISGLSWLHPRETPGQALTHGVSAGVQIGSQILQAKQLQQEEAWRHQQEQTLAPLRQAEREYWLQKKTLDIQNATTKAQQDLNTRKGFAAISDVIANVGAYREKWLDPNFQQDFWRVATQYPEISKDPAFDNILKNFELAERNRLNWEEARLRAETAKEGARTRAAATVTAAETRGHSAEEVARIRAAASQAANDADKIINQAVKATYLRRLHVIEKDPDIEADEKVRQIRNLAREFNLGPAVQFPDRTAAPASGKPSGYVRPTSQVEYDALPIGGTYIRPDGSRWVKR